MCAISLDIILIIFMNYFNVKVLKNKFLKYLIHENFYEQNYLAS